MQFSCFVINRIIVVAIACILLFLYGCLGGGGGSSSNSTTGGTLKVSVSPLNMSIKAGDKVKVTAKADCTSKDLFATSCSLASATVNLNGNKYDIPLGYTIKVGESKTFDIEFSNSYMALEPFSYLHNSNPSTSTANWTQHSEVIATTESKFVAFGDEVCVQNLTVNPQSQEVARGATAVYTIFGGKTPYKITSSVSTLPPNPTTVTTSGGTFSVSIPATTIATGATYTITDDAGKVVTATLTITPPAALSVHPASVKVSGVTGGLVKYDVRGGIPHYKIYTDNINYPPDTDTLLGEGSFKVNVPANSPKATVTYTVVDKALTEKKATLEIDVPSNQSISVASSQTCTPVNNFSFNLSDYTQGTMKIVAGDQVLEEKVNGTLSGAGSGTITKTGAGYTVSFKFSKAPAKGTPINAYYLTKVKPLSYSVKEESLKINYGDLTLVQAGSYLVDSNGKVYGQISGKTIAFTVPLMFEDAQMIAVYHGEPFNANGGVVVGKGDGTNRTFALKTKYSPLLEGSLKVFTNNQPGTITSVNLLTGEFTVVFGTPPAKDEDIKASYVLSKVNTVVNLEIDSFKFDIQLEVVK